MHLLLYAGSSGRHHELELPSRVCSCTPHVFAETSWCCKMLRLRASLRAAAPPSLCWFGLPSSATSLTQPSSLCKHPTKIAKVGAAEICAHYSTSKSFLDAIFYPEPKCRHMVACHPAPAIARLHLLDISLFRWKDENYDALAADQSSQSNSTPKCSLYS